MKYKIMTSMMTALLFSSTMHIGIAAASNHASAHAIAVPAEQQEVEPAMLVDQGMDKMLGFLKQIKLGNTSELAAFLDKEIAPFFDFAYMTKSAAGSMYRYMEPQQRERMADKIKKQFLETMSARLASYDSQQVRVISQRYGRSGNTATVSVAVLKPRGYPAKLDFRFYRAKTGWRVFDVSANGQSAVIHYRRQFRQLMYGSQYRQYGAGERPQAHRSAGYPMSK